MTNPKLPQEVIEARAAMLFKAPFFASIMFERSVVAVTDDTGMWRGMPVPTACTDGRHIVVNPTFFKGLSPSERVFVLCHEVFHLLARHPTRAKYYRSNHLFGQPYDHQLGNIAMDAVINKTLRDGGVGKMPAKGVNLTKELAALGYTLTGTEAWEDVYKVLLDNATVVNVGGASGGNGDPMAGDVADTGTADGEIPSEAEMKASIKSAAEAAAARSQGKLPGWMKSFIDELLEHQIPWQEKLQNLITTYASPDHYDWSRINRHKVVMPGLIMPRMTGVTCGHGVISFDTSGSVSDRELQAFLSEAAAILSEVRPEKLTLLWCDAQIDRVDEIDNAEDLLQLVRAEGVPGRGGTSFIPPFEHIQKMDETPVFHIYMTDGYGPFPEEAMAVCPTIWLINNDKVTPPFGEHIVLEVK